SSQCSCSGKTVDCYSRSLASVPAGIPTTTQVLGLSSNQITKLEPGVFDRLTALNIVFWTAWARVTCIAVLTERSAKQSRVNAGQLKSIPRGAFDNLKSLTHIWLYNNPWDC
uniref:Variable lymphocyte receptor B diversity region n=1 Tax=Petromyzon marinus TaxID=7757 RepID=S4RM03_PETMA